MAESHASAMSEEMRARIAAEARASAAVSAREALERELLEAVHARAGVEARVQIAVEGRKRAEAYAAEQGRRLGETEAELQRLRSLVQELLPRVDGPSVAAETETRPAPEARPAIDPPRNAAAPSASGVFGRSGILDPYGAPETRAQRKRRQRQERLERKADGKRTRELLAQAKRTRALIAHAKREDRRQGGARGPATVAATATATAPSRRPGALRVPVAVHVIGIAALLVAGGLFFVPWGASNADSAGLRLDQAGGMVDERAFEYSLLDMARLERASGGDRPEDAERLGEWLASTPDAARRQLEAVDPEALGEVLADASAVVTLDEVISFEGSFDEGLLTERFGDPGDGPWLGAQGALPFALQRCRGGLCLWHGVTERPEQLVDPAALLSEDASVKRLVAGLETVEPYLLQLHRSQKMAGELERLAGDGVPGIVTTGRALAGDADGATLLLGFDHESGEDAKRNESRIGKAVDELVAQYGADLGGTVEVSGTLLTVRLSLPLDEEHQAVVDAFSKLVA